MRSKRIPNSYPEPYSCAPGERYDDWLRDVEIWIGTEGGEMPEEVIGARILQSLKGTARKICRHIKPSQVRSPEGRQVIYQTLERSLLVRGLADEEGVQEQEPLEPRNTS